MTAVIVYIVINAFLCGWVYSMISDKSRTEMVISMLIVALFGFFLYIYQYYKLWSRKRS